MSRHWDVGMLGNHSHCLIVIDHWHIFYGCRSMFLSIVIEIPQVFDFGPNLFFIFINELPNCITKCGCNLLADGTILYAEYTSLDESESQLKSDIDNLMT